MALRACAGALVSTSAPRPSERTMRSSAYGLGYGRQAVRRAALVSTDGTEQAMVDAKSTTVPLGAVKSSRRMARAVVPWSTHRAVRSGRSRSAISQVKWCLVHHLVRRRQQQFWWSWDISGAEKRRFFVCSHTHTLLTSMCGRATRKYAKYGSLSSKMCA